MSIWERWCLVVSSLVVLVIMAFAILWIVNLTQPRVFQGYYLRHGGLRDGDYVYQIRIAWDNREDATVFRTYNPDEAFVMLNKLNAIGFHQCDTK